MKAAKYNFQFIKSQSLISWMDDNNVTTLYVDEIEELGLKYATSKDGHQILMASTVPGLCRDLQVCVVTNPRHRDYPGNFLLICLQPWSNGSTFRSTFTRHKSKRRNSNRFALAS